MFTKLGISTTFLRDERALAHNGARHGAEARLLELVLAPVFRLQRDFVPVRIHPRVGSPRAESMSVLCESRNDSNTAFFSHCCVVQSPLCVARRYARLARIEHSERGLHGVARFSARVR